jgi:hypothetical protein
MSRAVAAGPFLGKVDVTTDASHPLHVLDLQLADKVTGQKGILFMNSAADAFSAAFQPLIYGTHVTVFGVFTSTGSDVELQMFMNMEDNISTYTQSSTSFNVGGIGIQGNKSFSFTFDCAAPFVRFKANTMVVMTAYYSMRP